MIRRLQDLMDLAQENPPLHTGGKTLGPATGKLGHIEQLDHLLNAVIQLLAVQLLQATVEQEVLPGGESTV